MLVPHINDPKRKEALKDMKETPQNWGQIHPDPKRQKEIDDNKRIAAGEPALLKADLPKKAGRPPKI